ncbi:hypothetical protein GCM10010345_36010 [Streptomyces canarius]|uniref:Uncharacterized protein n=1 Tax=Streptomyces canarius TaxID=285453 RepID=A0ABQ3CMM6_9ACTN|nr:hypothetical protein GCM10010345_36010 [Streptomyces canarius]
MLCAAGVPHQGPRPCVCTSRSTVSGRGAGFAPGGVGEFRVGEEFREPGGSGGGPGPP